MGGENPRTNQNRLDPRDLMPGMSMHRLKHMQEAMLTKLEGACGVQLQRQAVGGQPILMPKVEKASWGAVTEIVRPCWANWNWCQSCQGIEDPSRKSWDDDFRSNRWSNPEKQALATETVYLNHTTRGRTCTQDDRAGNDWMLVHWAWKGNSREATCV